MKNNKNEHRKRGIHTNKLLLGVLLLILLGSLAYFVNRARHRPGGTPVSSQYSEEPELKAKSPRMRLLRAGDTGIDFRNEIRETPENNVLKNIYFYNGGGVAVADINNDSLPDLYFINCSGKNGLYLNLGHMKFRNITDGSGLEAPDGFETSVTAADVNADGYLDFYVCRAGPFPLDSRRNRLYINNHDLTFTEQAAAYGIDDPSMSTGANFFDYDNDGDLDLYVLNYPASFDYISKIEANTDPFTKQFKPDLKPKSEYDSDRLYRNDGPVQRPGSSGGTAAIKFTDVSKEAGIQNFAYGLSVGVSDINRDGWPDIYVGNDFIQPDLLYINNRNGTFTNQMDRYFRHSAQHTMGAELSDFDNDGLIDVLTLDMLPVSNYRQKSTTSTNSQSRYNTLIQYGYFEPVVRNVLQRNNGNGTFSDIACLAGIYKTDWSWSGLSMDLDNDGLKDMAITNGYRREFTDSDYMNFTAPKLRGSTVNSFDDVFKYIPTYKVRNFVFRNKGDWTFEDMSGKWMDMPASWSNGAVWADLDRDGDLDWVINNLEDEAFTYENLSAGQPDANFLQLKLVGNASNPFAVGASVELDAGGQKQYEELTPTRGIFSSVEHLIHFGLGSKGKADRILVRWPDGKTTLLTDVPANQRLTLKQSDANGQKPPAVPSEKTLFEETTAKAGLNFVHVEDPFNDFDYSFLQPWKLSDLGPYMAAGDVNGDGRDDVYIGNAFNAPGGLFLQTADGRFTITSKNVWEADKAYEDAGSIFFDADGDGDLDLLVLNGGVEADYKAAGIDWKSRLYRNDGKGNFSNSETALPAMRNPGSRIALYDYDGDGDQDLFIGGRVVAGKYPLTPGSYVFRNEGNGRFTDVTSELGGDFIRCGMVTDLVWANIDADPQPELIVAGEWMPVSVFKMKNGKLENETTGFGLDQSNGLWNKLVVSDLDNDGDLDIVTGNFGFNSRLTASANQPLHCYAKDFDQNGSIEPIMTFFENGKEYPLMRQDVVVKQMPSLKKRFLYAKDYGKATVEDIFPRSELNTALTLSASTLATCWWENQNGRFVCHNLPIQAQVSPVNGILVDDFNHDGHPDILLAGNKYGMEVETGRCDAGIGALFLGDGKGGFAWADNRESGFYAGREARDLALLRSAGGKRLVVVANNNDKPQVFQQ